MNIVLILLLMLFSANLSASGSYVDKWQWNDGRGCAIYFDASHESNIKVHWDGNGEPPLKISDAKKLVLDWVMNEYQAKVSANIVSYDLTSYRAEGFKMNHWIYNIRFVKFRDGAPDNDFNENVVVLMDGNILSKQCIP